jgi:hypothetical protein
MTRWGIACFNKPHRATTVGWAELHSVGRPGLGLLHDLVERQRAELGIEQLHREAIIEQRPANTEQTQGRQLLPRHARANGRVRWIDEENVHGDSIRGVESNLHPRRRIVRFKIGHERVTRST